MLDTVNVDFISRFDFQPDTLYSKSRVEIFKYETDPGGCKMKRLIPLRWLLLLSMSNTDMVNGKSDIINTLMRNNGQGA